MKKLILFLLIFSTWGCAKDTSQSNSEQQALSLATSSCAMSISYDAEVTSITQPQNPADASKVTNQDKVMAQPFVKRNQVQVCIQDDGQSEWLIETKKPKNGFEPKNEGLPDPTPKTQTVRIANGKMVFIDKKGNVLRERDFNMTTFSTMAKMLKQASQNPSEMDFLHGSRSGEKRPARDAGCRVSCREARRPFHSKNTRRSLAARSC